MSTSKKNEILIVLTDEWCDWEASYSIAVANSYSDYIVKTIAIDYMPKVSMGGIKSAIDYITSDYDNYDSLAMIILPGGLSWKNNAYAEIADFVRKVRALQIPIAAICGASTFLCRNGFLDNVKHTGDSLEHFQSQPGYNGASNYVEAQVVVDDGIITANETAAVPFAYEIFKILQVDSDEEIEIWYDNFKNGAVR